MANRIGTNGDLLCNRVLSDNGTPAETNATAELINLILKFEKNSVKSTWSHAAWRNLAEPHKTRGTLRLGEEIR